MKCKYCFQSCNKAGRQSNSVQKYRCIGCGKYQQERYKYKACSIEVEEMIVRCLKAGCGIRSTRLVLKISCTTIISKIRRIGSGLESDYKGSTGRTYEMDELYTYVGNRDHGCWLIYAIDRATRQVVHMVVGRRTTENIKKVTDKLLEYAPRKIHTDKLNIYPGILNKNIHRPGRYITNRIERYNLTLRTHLKRLSRSTICYSKRQDMLEACLKIYFWV